MIAKRATEKVFLAQDSLARIEEPRSATAPSADCNRVALAPRPERPEGKRRDRSRLVHLYRRGRIWWVQYILDGQRVRESLRTENRKIAQDLSTDREYKLRNRLLGRARKIPLQPFLTEYFAHKKARLGHKGFSTDSCYLRRFFEAVPVTNLNDLTTASITAHLTHRRQERVENSQRKKGIAPKTANRIRQCLGTMYAYAIKQGYLLEDPVAKVERFREPAHEIVYLSLAEIDELFALVRKDIIFELIATITYAGLRRSEACWLRWSDVNLKDKPHLKVVPKEDDGEEWQPKTRRTRIVPLSPKLVEILKTMPHRGDWVFLSPEGCRWDGDNLTHRFEKIMKAAKRTWTMLILRHTFGSQLAMKGVAIQKIARFMGNSVLVCMRHYAGLMPEELQADITF